MCWHKLRNEMLTYEYESIKKIIERLIMKIIMLIVTLSTCIFYFVVLTMTIRTH